MHIYPTVTRRRIPWHLEGLGGVATSLGGVTDPAPKMEGEEEAEEEETPKKEEAAKDGIAEGGFNAGKVEELPRKLPEKGARVRIGSRDGMGEERIPRDTNLCHLQIRLPRFDLPAEEESA